MIVVTKSYRPDFELCKRLNRSVLEYAAPGIDHLIVVPRSDVALFAELESGRTKVICDSDVLPKHFIQTFHNVTINLKCPWPPIRGWIQQQIVKLATIAATDASMVLTVDSDVEFIRPFSEATFSSNGVINFFRGPRTVGTGLPRHMKWHALARELLALPASAPPYPDYINSPIPWNPRRVREMLDRVSTVSGRSWESTVSARLDFSECVLYGVYVDECAAAADVVPTADVHCASYWLHEPMTESRAEEFVSAVKATDVSIMIPSKSNTSPEVRDFILAALRH